MTSIDDLSPELKKSVLLLLEEKERRVRRNKIITYFPDKGPLRRELYPKHLKFFKAGKKFRERCMLAANRIGKMQPYSSLIQTPFGHKTMGEIQEGDLVFDETGMPCLVLATFEQGEQLVFKVTFDDGSSTRCGLDHLWSFVHPKDRFEHTVSHGRRVRVRTYNHRTVADLSTIIDIGGMEPKPLRRVAIPVTKPVEFVSAGKLPIKPYLMGALLGDECFGKEATRFCNVDQEIINRVRDELPSGLSLTKVTNSKYDYLISTVGDTAKRNEVRNALRCTGLHCTKSRTKFIPELYKIQSSENRLELLRGLMDTDGSIYGAGIMEYYTNSERLANDVKWLVMSLGGKAKVQQRTVKGDIRYRVRIEIQSCNPFYLKRKRDRFFVVKHRPDRLLVKIEVDKVENCKCILVDSPTHTYLTDDFIVTHNTEGCTLYEAVHHMTGLYPEWWEGRRFDRPVKAWFVGTTAETTRDILQRKLLGPLDDLGTGLIPGKMIIGKPRMDSGIPDSVETFLVKHISGGTSRGQFKAYKQGRKSFEGDEIDIVVCDEEPPLDIYSEILLRTMTTNGMVLVGFTPKEGLTGTVLSFMPGGLIPKEEQMTTKFIIGASWDDVPHLTEEAKAEILESTPLYLRNAVSKGIPQLGSGAIYPIEEEAIMVTDFSIPEHWPQAYAQDVGWNWTAAVWGAWDREHDVWYIHSTYKRGQAEPEVHAAAIKARGDWIPGIMDPAANARNPKDGTRLKEQYEELMDADITNAVNSVEAGLLRLYTRMTKGKLKVFRSCQDWFEEFRIYRRDKDGKVVKKNDHLMDCTRYLIMTGTDVATTRQVSIFRNLSVGEILDRIGM